MGQIEVYTWLKIAQKKEDRFYSIAEIKAGLLKDGFSGALVQGVPGDLVRLGCSGYLDTQVNGNVIKFNRLFKLKGKYLG